jgi:hypothetical protein
MLNVSATTPSPGNEASPCTTMGSTRASSRSPLRLRCFARATPWSTGFTTSRWLGFGTSSSSTAEPPSERSQVYPRWYLTSPVPLAEFVR